MYATPIIYPLSIVPPSLRWIAALNPLSVCAEAMRVMLLGAGTVVPEQVAISATTGVVLLACGLLLFGRVDRKFVDVA